jgi:hypothetical protein
VDDESKASTSMILLIIAWGLLVLFNVAALGVFAWAGTFKASTDDAAGFTLVSVLVAWIGDLVGFAIALAGGVKGRPRPRQVIASVLAILAALASAVFFPLAGFVRFVASAPIPIH